MTVRCLQYCGGAFGVGDLKKYIGGSILTKFVKNQKQVNALVKTFQNISNSVKSTQAFIKRHRKKYRMVEFTCAFIELQLISF